MAHEVVVCVEIHVPVLLSSDLLSDGGLELDASEDEIKRAALELFRDDPAVAMESATLNWVDGEGSC